MWGEGFSVISELRKTTDAESYYDLAMAEGRLTSLAQQYRDGLVNLAVGNLQPGETVWVELDLLAGLDVRDDGWRFRFPFTLAPLYHRKARALESRPDVGKLELPGEPDGGILPTWLWDARDLHRIGFELRLALPTPLRALRSPTHRIEVRQETDAEVLVRLATDADAPNRDLVLEATSRDPFTAW